jgi:hypothetical protein
MKSKLSFFLVFLIIIPLVSCKKKEAEPDLSIIFLHHSTGSIIWRGESRSFANKVAGRISDKLVKKMNSKGVLPSLFEAHNIENQVNYQIEEMAFPKQKPYGWNNFPYDYYNIWVKNEGETAYMEEPTLEMLTREYQLIIFKHCFPVSNIEEDLATPDINSKTKTLANYKLQYAAIKEKLHEFPSTKFILFTGAVQVKANNTEEKAKRAREFFEWVRQEWDEAGDNIYLWDLSSLQTEGGLYFKDEYALSPENSHPNGDFAGMAVELLFNRIIDVAENDGKGTLLTGKPK